MTQKKLPKVVAAFACHKKWSQLEGMKGSSARWCGSCQQEVFRIENIEGLRKAIAANRCTYLDSEYGPVMGRMEEPDYGNIPET